MKYEYDVFLSYKSDDQEWVEMLKISLQKRGVRVWLDKDMIRPGDYFTEALENGLENSQTVAIIVTPQSLQSQWVQEEYRRALSLANQDKGRIIPCILKDAEMPGFMASRQWIDFTNPDHFDANVDYLIWPGITGKRIECIDFGHDGGMDWWRLFDISQKQGVPIRGSLSSSRIHTWFRDASFRFDNEPESYGHEYFPPKSTRGVLVLSLPVDHANSTRTYLDFIQRCRESRDGINEKIVFVLFQNSDWKRRLNQLNLNHPIINRIIDHYFWINKDLDDSQLGDEVRRTWNLVQIDLIRSERWNNC